MLRVLCLDCNEKMDFWLNDKEESLVEWQWPSNVGSRHFSVSLVDSYEAVLRYEHASMQQAATSGSG